MSDQMERESSSRSRSEKQEALMMEIDGNG